MTHDISRNVVAILLVLVVLVSAVGTWAFLNAVSNQPEPFASSSGEVSLRIGSGDAPAQTQTANAAAAVSLKIAPMEAS